MIIICNELAYSYMYVAYVWTSSYIGWLLQL